MTVMDTPANTGTDYSDTDFCDPRVYDDPYALYAWLRDQDSLHRDEANDLYIAAAELARARGLPIPLPPTRPAAPSR